MINLKSIVAGVALAFVSAVACLAQGVGQLGPGQVWGNSSAQPGRGAPASISQMIDQSVGSTRGSVLYRGAAGWAVRLPGTAGLPLVSVGPGADPTYAQVGANALPAPTASTLGGVQSSTCSTSNWFRTLSTAGVLGCSEPSFADLAGSLACTQTPALTGDVSTAAGSCATTLATVNANVGTFGTATAVPQITLDGKGRATAASTNPIPTASAATAGLAKCDNSTITCPGGVFSAAAVAASSAWSNTRLAKTAAYTTVSGDCSDTLALGGGAYYSATFNAPSGYTSNCAFLVTNEDTNRAKLLLPQFASSTTSITIGTGAKAFTTSSGLTFVAGQRYRVYSLANNANWMAGTASYATTTLTLTVDTVGGSGTFTDWQIAPEIYLWPGTQRWVFNQNNVWQLSPFHRWLLPGAGNIYELCWAQNGSDSNDGLGGGSGCLAKVQTVVNIIGTQWDGGGYNNCAIGIYAGGTGIINEAVSQTGASVGCYLTVNMRGAITWQNSSFCWSAGDGAIAVFNFNLGFVPTFQCNSSNTASSGQFYGHQVVIYDFFGPLQWFPGGTNDTLLFMDAQGRATFDGSAKNVGSGAAMSARSLVDCDNGCSGIGVSGSWNFSANVSLGQAYIIRNGGYINTTATYTSAPTPSAPTTTPIGGARLLTNGTTIPGGTTSGTLNGLVCTSVC